METKTFALSPQSSRRFSCPNIEATPMIVSIAPDKTNAHKAAQFSKTKTPMSTTVETVHIQTSKIPGKLPSGQDYKSAGSQFHDNKKPLVISALSPLGHVTSLLEDTNFGPEYKNKMVAQSNVLKNEAEIIADFPMNQRRRSFPGISGSDKLAAAINASGSKSKSQVHRRASATESVDSLRELRSLHRNNLEDRRLRQAFCKLERQSFAGSLEFRQKIKEVFKDHKKILQKSPTADEWLLLKKSRSNALQEKEREDIARRYSRRVRHFRAPPYLHDTVAKIRSHAMMEAGLLLEPEWDSSGDEELVTKIEALNMSRRHTISGDLAANLPRISQNQSKTSNYFGRRVTLADTRILHDVLELKADRMHKCYINDFVKEMSNVTNTEQIPKDDFDHSVTRGEIDTNMQSIEDPRNYENEKHTVSQECRTKHVEEDLDVTNVINQRNIGVDHIHVNETQSSERDQIHDYRHPIRVHDY